MRLTADLLNRAEQRTNCLGDRELVLSGMGIPAVENMGAAQDGFDCLDLSSNLLMRLDNFSKLHRLSHLLAGGNRIETIDGRNLGVNVPNLKTISLSHNNISSLAEVKTLGKSCLKLEFLDLTGNPVTKRQYYRLYTIHCIPSLKCLDYIKIKKAERSQAERLAKSAAGAALESDVQQSSVKTFTPGENEDGTAVVTLFTAAEKEAIRNLLANAESVLEVEEIENAVKRGVLPGQLRTRNGDAETNEHSSKRLKV